MSHQLFNLMTNKEGKIKINFLTKEKETSYVNFVSTCQHATPYHTLAWRDISCSVFGHVPYFLIAETEGNIQGVLPLFFVKGIFGPRLVSVPLRDKGGPLYNSPEVLKTLLSAARKLMIDLQCKYIHIKAWHGLDFNGDVPSWIMQHDYFINSSVPIENGHEGIWKRFEKRSVQRPIKKSIREGVTCFWGNSLGDMKEFYRIFLLTRKKLGVPPYGFDLFYAIWEKMINCGSAGLLLARYGDHIISGLIMFFFNKSVICGYAASDKKYLFLRPNNLIFWEAMKYACEHGYTCFDFGADSPDNQNLLSFKKGFGAVTKILPHYYIFNDREVSFAIDFDSKKYRIYRKLFALLPISISRRIGPIIVRQLS